MPVNTSSRSTGVSSSRAAQCGPEGAASVGDGDVTVADCSLLLLDADGVLLDTPHEAAWRAAARVARAWFPHLSAGGGRELSPAYYADRIAGRSRDRGAAAVLAWLGVEPSADLITMLATTKQEIFRREVAAGHSGIFADALALLGVPGPRAAVVTASRNARELLARYLARTPRLVDRLALVVTPDTLGTRWHVAKRDLVLEALRALQVDGGRTVFVDDSMDSLCEVADLGLTRIRLDRSHACGHVRADGITTIGSLHQLRIDEAGGRVQVRLGGSA